MTEIAAAVSSPKIPGRLRATSPDEVPRRGVFGARYVWINAQFVQNITTTPATGPLCIGVHGVHTDDSKKLMDLVDFLAQHIGRVELPAASGR